MSPLSKSLPPLFFSSNCIVHHELPCSVTTSPSSRPLHPLPFFWPRRRRKRWRCAGVAQCVARSPLPPHSSRPRLSPLSGSARRRRTRWRCSGLVSVSSGSSRPPRVPLWRQRQLPPAIPPLWGPSHCLLVEATHSPSSSAAAAPIPSHRLLRNQRWRKWGPSESQQQPSSRRDGSGACLWHRHRTNPWDRLRLHWAPRPSRPRPTPSYRPLWLPRPSLAPS